MIFVAYVSMSFAVLYVPLLCLFLSVFMPLPLNCFNIETKNVRVILGPNGTQFGYTTRFVPATGTDKLRLVVGAPHANTGNVGPRTGTVHLCGDLLNKQEQCTDTLYLADKIQMLNGSFGEDFGSSVAVTSDNTIVICSPRWRDTRPANNNNMFMPGRCSLYNLRTKDTKEFKPYYHQVSQSKVYVVKIGTTEYYHGLASYGFSADSNQDSVFVIGSPGILKFEGNIRIHDQNTGEASDIKTIFDANKLEATAYGYLGYSLKIGKFCNGSDICIAAGAPNQNRVGMVHIYKWTDRTDLERIQLITGPQAWSYFGYAVAAVDVNEDSFQELLIGAPYYTDIGNTVDGFDQGRVFVYSRTPAVQNLALTVTLNGGRSKYARFGSAIGSIGDVNLDGFQDIAVGAPSEDDGAGCIYIYLGGRSGLSSTPSQKITATQLSAGLDRPIKGIGFSFSDYASHPTSAYGIFTTGSIVSDAVVVFQSRPVVDVEATLEAIPNPVNIEVSCSLPGIMGACLRLTFCMKYEIRKQDHSDLNFQIGLEIDVQVRLNLKRALFKDKDGKLVDKIPMTKTTLKAGRKCMDYEVIIRESQVNQDRFNPVEIVATYSLDDDQLAGINPILDALQPNNATLLVTFVNKCGGDNICDVDLGITGAVDYTHTGQWQSVVVNHTKELMVNVKIKNSMDTSYWTVVTVEVDSALPFSRSISEVSVSCVAVQDTVAESEDNAAIIRAPQKSTVKCNYYKPLEKATSIDLMVAFVTDNLDLTKRTLNIHAEAMPQNKINNPEMKPDDNKINLNATVAIISDVSIEGSSSPVEVTLSDAKQLSLTSNTGYKKGFHKPGESPNLINVTNKILVRNNGPSFLPETTVIVSVPMFLVDGTPLVHEAEVKLTSVDGEEIQCTETITFDYLGDVETAPTTAVKTSATTTSSALTSTDASSTSKSTSTSTASTTTDEWGFIPSVNRRKRDTDDNTRVLDTIYTLGCNLNKDLCQVFECRLKSSLAPNGHAEINVALELDKANVPIPKDFTTCYFLTSAEVIEPKHPLFVSWTHPKLIQTVTKFHLVQSGGKINIWIIIGSIIAGLVLITIIVIICWKMGFFKRQKHHEVERWKRESIRRSRKINPKSATEEAEKNEIDANAATHASDGDL